MGSASTCLSQRTDLIAWRCTVLCVAAIVPVLCSGCVITPPTLTHSQAVRDEVVVVAIAPAQYVPVPSFSTFAKDKR